MKSLSLACSTALCLFTASSYAQTAAPPAPPVSTSEAKAAPKEMTKEMPKEMTEAQVRKVDKAAKKVTLQHGPIKNLDMPPMTMVFQVRDEKLLDKLSVGDKIKFSAQQLQGAFVVTAVEPMIEK